jgi:hypothetical protein
MVRQRADAERTDPIDRDWAAGARPTKAADSRHEQIQWGTLNESHRQFSPCEMHLPQVVEGKRLLLAFCSICFANSAVGRLPIFVQLQELD